ncbi:DUF6531 domain-containing protein, partial [Winkia neuii]|uniref:DUF6531 domain-containing protein n=2 Tax=Winkia neuii TaxID=33007 RepID=UPI000763C8D7
MRLRGISEDVWGPDQEGVSEGFLQACRSLLLSLSEGGQDMRVAAGEAKVEFRGYFADLLARNREIETRERADFMAALSGLIRGIGQAQEAAKAEQDRRERARKFEEEHAKWEKGRKNFFGGEGFYDWLHSEPEIDLSTARPGKAPTIVTKAVGHTGHDLPEPGTVSARSGTCSAVAENLLVFSDAAWRCFLKLGPVIDRFGKAYEKFENHWKFKSGPRVVAGMDDFVGALRSYNQENRADGKWVEVIAQAFTRAGGSGQVVSLSEQSLLWVLESAGAATYRDQLEVPALSLVGVVPSTGFADDPVSTVTGNFVFLVSDFVFPSMGSVLGLSRTYNSVCCVGENALGGAFGAGWSSVLDQCLSFDREGAYWRTGQGRQIFFPCPGSAEGGFVIGDDRTRSVGDNYWLTRSRGGFRIVDNAGFWWLFDVQGRWVSSGFGTEDSVRARRDEEGRISRLEHCRGGQIAFTYAAGLVVSACDGVDRIEYVYDGSKLARTKSNLGQCAYVWSGPFIESISDESGTLLCRNDYDRIGRVVCQRSAQGRVSKYSYLGAGTVSVSDLDGGRSNTYRSDRWGRTVGVVDSAGYGQQMAYDRWGNLLFVSDRLGYTHRFTYDERSRISQEVLAGGGRVCYEWDELDRLVSVRSVQASSGQDEPSVDQAGAGYRLFYQDDGRYPVEIVNPVGGVTRACYNEGLLTGIVDPEGTQFSFSYDDQCQIVCVVGPGGATYRFDRDGRGRVVRTTLPTGEQTCFSYDEAGRLISEQGPDGAKTVYSYGSSGRLLRVIQPDGGVYKFTYDQAGQVVSVTDPAGLVSECDFDDLGNLISFGSASGKTGFEFDGLSRLIRVSDAGGASWQASYDPAGRVAGVVDPCGVVTQFAYAPGVQAVARAGRLVGRIRFDTIGRVRQVEEGSGRVERIDYDGASLPVSVTSLGGGRREFVRDKAGRVIREVSECGVETSYSYDEAGRVGRVECGGEETQYFYDASSRLVRVLDGAGGVSQFTYDGCGRLASASTTGGGRAEFSYDECGRIICARDLVHGIGEFSYDKAGRLRQAASAMGGKYSYTYDGAGRLERVTGPGGAATSYTYDGAGRVESVTDPVGRTRCYAYDKVGRIVGEEVAGEQRFFDYDAGGRLACLRVGDREVFRASRSANTVTVKDRQGIDELVFGPDGRLQEHTRCRGGVKSSWQWAYDLQGRLESLQSSTGDVYSYEYSSAGRVQKVWRNNQEQCVLDYDGAGNLTRRVVGDSVQEFSYEGGFVSSYELTGPSSNVSVRVERDSWGRIKGIETGEGRFEYSYNRGGALTGMVTPSGRKAWWDWDECGRLIRRQGCDGTVVDFAYDQAGQLVSTSTTTSQGKVDTAYRYDQQGRRISQRSSNGDVRSYSWDYLGRLVGVSANGETTAIGFDVFGRPERIGENKLDWGQSALGLGGPNICAGSSWDAGRVWVSPYRSVDPAAPFVPDGTGIDGLFFMGARVYDAHTQCFLSPDPLPAAPGSMWQGNPYDYAGANPLSLSDPLGLKPITDAQMRALAT